MTRDTMLATWANFTHGQDNFYKSARDLLDFCEDDELLQDAMMYALTNSDWVIKAMERFLDSSSETPEHIKLFLKLNSVGGE